MEPIKCLNCGNLFFPGNDEHGIPNGVGLVYESGIVHNVCSRCLMYHHKDVMDKIDEIEKKAGK